MFWQAGIDLIVLWPDPQPAPPLAGRITRRHDLMFAGLFDDPQVRSDYVPAVASDGLRALVVIARRDWLAGYAGGLDIRALDWTVVR